MKIGILGGTFDPIHFGHLIAAEQARDRLALDRVILIPARIPPHKTTSRLTEGVHRMALVRLAVAGVPGFEVSDCELNRPGCSYTIDTVRALMSSGDIHLIMGQDSFMAIETWQDYGDLMELCRLVVVPRPGSPALDPRCFSDMVRQFFPSRVIGLESEAIERDRTSREWKICLLSIPGLNISATEIRESLRAGRSIRFLVPESVREYIESQGLYRDNPPRIP